MKGGRAIMAKLRKDDVADLDVDALDEAEYDDAEFESYSGDVPPVGTELTGYLKSLWWTRTRVKPDGTGDDPMLKVLWIAAENKDDEEEYNGLPVWLNLPLIASVKFRWAPFLEVYGITLKQIKNSTYVSGDEDQFGAPIERIGDFRPGEESDAAWCRIISDRERYDEQWQARVKTWLPWDDAGTEDGDGEPEEPGDREVELFEDEDGYLINADGEYVDADGELVDDPVPAQEEDPEPEPEPEPPAQTRRSGRADRTAPAAPPARSAPAGRSGRSAPAKPAAATSARSGRSSGRSAPARTARPADTKPAGRGRGGRRSSGSDEEPPF